MFQKESLALVQVIDDVITALLIYYRKNPDGFREVSESNLHVIDMLFREVDDCDFVKQ